ncbi:hypothetical protein J4467_03175 [Candidatus Woesearchaeota archaeon]|nr:hypothetical protein [Candidatus Woesearchaeota archaeon]
MGFRFNQLEFETRAVTKINNILLEAYGNYFREKGFMVNITYDKVKFFKNGLPAEANELHFFFNNLRYNFRKKVIGGGYIVKCPVKIRVELSSYSSIDKSGVAQVNPFFSKLFINVRKSNWGYECTLGWEWDFQIDVNIGLTEINDFDSEKEMFEALILKEFAVIIMNLFMQSVRGFEILFNKDNNYVDWRLNFFK